ncbi:MAG: DNA mismatch repair endonuclease MutL [Flavobacteriales bacterium]|nr:DNA mismatch repair endonuclease MutL [Flavobacteriales bacterium]
MSDIIRLLPDSVANQIAAGEVIQRPASAVKELLENAIDAGATRIRLIVRDAGRTLIQVIDNGCGMSENDARMCFERHATSKISSADDLFALRTKGFRGEAMASIAAMAQVEMQTRLHDREVGLLLRIEGSKVTAQEPCQCTAGTSIAVKNLFFNVPARRNFLKSDAVEMRHITDEFLRVALPHTDIEFTLHHNEDEIFNLKASNLRQRIVALFGPAFNEKLVPISEDTSIASLHGFIGKPEFARKTRGEQFFFVNNRFIRSNYLNHAVSVAYDEMVKDRSFPAFFIFIDVEPSAIDINIHPTKTEVKFEDEKSMYAILRSSVRQSLGRYNIAPTLDFDQEMSINIPLPPRNVQVVQPELPMRHRPTMPTMEDGRKQPGLGIDTWQRQRGQEWQDLYDGLEMTDSRTESRQSRQGELLPDTEMDKHPVQVHQRYILASIRSGVVLIDQKRAHERVIFEKAVRGLAMRETPSQQTLFPINIELSTGDAQTLNSMMEDVRILGIDIAPFGRNSFVVHGLATFIAESAVQSVLDELINEFRESGTSGSSKQQERLAHALARKSAIPHGKTLQREEMAQLIDELFGCDQPYVSPNGKPTMVTLSLEELEKRFA